MNITASDLVSLLRSEVNSFKNNSEVSNLSLCLTNKSGKVTTITIANKQWYAKPSETNGLVKLAWIDTKQARNSDNGTTYTVTQPTQCEYIDPAELSGFEFRYDVTTVTNVVVNPPEPEPEPENNGGEGE